MTVWGAADFFIFSGKENSYGKINFWCSLTSITPYKILVKIEVSLCLAVIFRLNINVIKAFPRSHTERFRQKKKKKTPWF
jgi:hypothetical protein